MESRRDFVMKIASGLTAPGHTSIPTIANTEGFSTTNVFVHHVFFWLKDPNNAEARKNFENGLQSLAAIPQIKSHHIGTPVESPREVVDDSFTYSYLTFFRSKEDQEEYQNHPIHLKFIEDCQHLWKKVIVYDAMD